MSVPAVAIVGTGLIGRSWAISFARTGCTVRLFDHLPGAADAALRALEEMLGALAKGPMLHGQQPKDVMRRIGLAQSLDQAVDGVVHVQENTPEKLDTKRAVFAELDEVTPPEAVIASSTSALLPSSFSQDLPGAARCLVVHPLNPPHLIPAVEIVPSPQTAQTAIQATSRFMEKIGQKPLVVRREVEGFIMNRLQGALLDEAIALVAEGYASVEDIDTAMKEGLARRWAFMGPFETIDLNAPEGVSGYFERYGPAYAAIGKYRPTRYEWSGQVAASIAAARRSALPLDQHAKRQAWRDTRLAALAEHFFKDEQVDE